MDLDMLHLVGCNVDVHAILPVKQVFPQYSA
jgi:hypothetical protein